MGTCYFNFNQQQIRELFTFASNAYKYEDMLEWLGKTADPLPEGADLDRALKLLELLGIKDETRTTFIKRCLNCNLQMLVEILKEVANARLNNESSEEEDWFSDITRKILIITTASNLEALFQGEEDFDLFDYDEQISSFFDDEVGCETKLSETQCLLHGIEEPLIAFLWVDLFLSLEFKLAAYVLNYCPEKVTKPTGIQEEPVSIMVKNIKETLREIRYLGSEVEIMERLERYMMLMGRIRRNSEDGVLRELDEIFNEYMSLLTSIKSSSDKYDDNDNFSGSWVQ